MSCLSFSLIRLVDTDDCNAIGSLVLPIQSLAQENTQKRVLSTCTSSLHSDTWLQVFPLLHSGIVTKQQQHPKFKPDISSPSYPLWKFGLTSQESIPGDKLEKSLSFVSHGRLVLKFLPKVWHVQITRMQGLIVSLGQFANQGKR